MNARPKILFLTSSAPQSSGDATAPFILSMAADLQQLGFEVHILAPHAPGIMREEVLEGVRIIRFRYIWPEHWQRLTAGGSAMVHLRTRPWMAALIPLFVLAQYMAAARLLRRERYQILHAHWLLPQGAVGALLARRFRLPLVTMIHGADIVGLQHYMWQKCKAWTISCTNCMIANSRFTATEAQKLSNPRQLEIIPVGAMPPHTLDPPIWPREKFADSQQTLLIFCGRMIAEKGVDILLQAMTHLPSNMRLLLIGGGPERARFEALARQLGLCERVHFIGALAHRQIAPMLALGDMFIAPSRHFPGRWAEAQGNAIIEAMLAGLPVIASEVGGIPDAVRHEQTGLLVPQGNAAALADAITRLAHDKAMAACLAAAGKAHAEAHFTRARTAHRIATIYRQLLTS